MKTPPSPSPAPALLLARLLALVLVLTASLVSTSCQTPSSSSSLEQAPAKLQKGITTKAEVEALLGEPGRRRVDASGETWLYGGAKERDTGDVAVDQAIGIGSGFIPVPYVGTAISGLRSLGRSAGSAQSSATIQFDHKGLLKDYVIELP